MGGLITRDDTGLAARVRAPGPPDLRHHLGVVIFNQDVGVRVVVWEGTAR